MEISIRLDKYVSEQVDNISRAMAAKLIEQGKVLVNRQPQLKPSYRLKETDKVTVKYKPNTPKKKLDLPVIYESKDVIVINKPAGILSHSKGVFNPEPTVASWLKPKVKDFSDDRAGIVHRLDRGTSGVMICAKNLAAQKFLQKQFAARRTKKTYIAVIEGHLEPLEAIIDMPIERNPKKPQSFRVAANGKPAVTAYKVLQSSDKCSLVELKPTTGRTHQLRVHLKKLNRPILGDVFYGASPAKRMYLHALSLELTLPDSSRQTFTAPLPKDFTGALK